MTIRLQDLFQGAIHPLEWYITNRLVTRRFHPELPYAILNYTPKCVYDRHWDLVTRKCRGLIYRLEDDVVLARPYQKFFNYGEPDGPDIDSSLTGDAYDKLDGSLGILYPLDYLSWAIATRGSFESEQAVIGTEMLQQYLDAGWQPLADRTYLFEIIHPEVRVVIDYGDFKDIVLLDVLETSTGFKAYDRNWIGPTAEMVAENLTIHDIAQLPNRRNREGVVWVQHGPFDVRVKVKQPDYVEKHKLVFGLNARIVWENVVSGMMDILFQQTPEEFHPWIHGCVESLQEKFQEKRKQAYDFYGDVIDALPPVHTRKDFALEVQRRASHPELVGLAFLLFDGRSIDERCWEMVKPSGEERAR